MSSTQSTDMGKTHWFLVGTGAIGGALMVSSVNAFAFLQEPFNYFTALAMFVTGLIVIYYARFA